MIPMHQINPPKIARSSGDGAPATSPADAYSSSVSKVPVNKGPSDAFTQSPGRPKFYTSDSDAELTSHSSVDLHRSDFPSPEQLRVSASRIIYKALELLSSKSPECPSNHHFTGGTSSLVTSPEARRVGPWNSAYQAHSIGSDRSGGSHGSVHSFSSDQFEYDELHMSPSLNNNLGNYSSSFNALDPEEDERLQREEEAQLMHLLSTLTSLLEKVDHMSSGSPPSPNVGTDGDSCDAANQSPTSVAAGRTKKNVPFTDLFQSASDITEDLQSLEEILDKLRYKLQANQIELEQAEDKLDYAWHLHENLDESLADSLSCGSLASLSSEPGPRYPSTINPTVTLPSPLVLEVGVTESRKNTDPTAGSVSASSHLHGATDIAVTDSLLTSYTSSYTSSSAEPDRLFQSMTDSACGRSIRSSQTMIRSVPDAGSLTDDSNQLELVYPRCATLDRPRPGRVRTRSKQMCTSFRRSTFHTDRPYQVMEHEPTSDYEENVDPDGFLHPGRSVPHVFQKQVQNPSSRF
ncbi:hypothetical protein FBUS_11604 [Fasciolopsis buskii]|uniref:Uncharacterized protein n=2 Tax=Fasciolopsis buskii TaxID=27845 RepID=A0A8E0RL66_9TREM|nr:hypothetical protein FBUS_11604 [Fasciolopsis buski]